MEKRDKSPDVRAIFRSFRTRTEKMSLIFINSSCFNIKWQQTGKTTKDFDDEQDYSLLKRELSRSRFFMCIFFFREIFSFFLPLLDGITLVE